MIQAKKDSVGLDALHIRVPRVLSKSEAVMVMSLETGRHYKTLSVHEQRYCLQQLFKFSGSCLFNLGVAQCDPHPGNILLDGDKVVILDWGTTCSLWPEERVALLNIFRMLWRYGMHAENEAAAGAMASCTNKIAEAMKVLGFQTHMNTDEGLAIMARHAFDSRFPAPLKAMKEHCFGSQADPPLRAFPPKMTPLLRLRVMCGGLAANLARDLGHDLLHELNTLVQWSLLARQAQPKESEREDRSRTPRRPLQCSSKRDM